MNPDAQSYSSEYSTKEIIMDIIDIMRTEFGVLVTFIIMAYVVRRA